MEPEPDNSSVSELIQHVFAIYPTMQVICHQLALLYGTTEAVVKEKLGYDDRTQSLKLFIDLSRDERLNKGELYIAISRELSRLLQIGNLPLAEGCYRQLHLIVARLALQFISDDLFSVSCDYCGRKLSIEHIPLQCEDAACSRYFDVCASCESTITHGHFRDGICFRHSPYYLDQWRKRHRNDAGQANLEHFIHPIANERQRPFVDRRHTTDK